jgi:hypothetical protein
VRKPYFSVTFKFPSLYGQAPLFYGQAPCVPVRRCECPMTPRTLLTVHPTDFVEQPAILATFFYMLREKHSSAICSPNFYTLETWEQGQRGSPIIAMTCVTNVTELGQ